MNKSLLTNLFAGVILLAGWILSHPVLQAVGLFAVSGAITNWLAVHMLFERIPGLYGSGVVPLHFDDFRRGIRALILTQFFTTENIERFLADGPESGQIDLDPVIEEMDLSPTFDSLISTIEESSFGSFLAMAGGAQGLSGLRAPYIQKMKASLKQIAASAPVQQAIQDHIDGHRPDSVRERVEAIIENRLNELTPEMVKQIVQEMIREHLGWLVVWGGVFGGLMGLVYSQLVSTPV